MTPSVLISCITRSEIHSETVRWLLDQQHPVDIVCSKYTIEHQRNWQVERFLERDEDYLFMVDADVVPKKGTVEELLKHVTPSTILVAPPYAFADDPHETVVMAYRRLANGRYQHVPHVNGLLEIDGTGMSGALLPRSVFHDVAKPWFKMLHDDDGKLRVTEDFYFWENVQRAGYRIKAHLGLVADHLKPVYLSFLPENNGY